MSNIFLKCWNLIGRAEYLKNAGDYFTASLVGVSLIIIRGEDGSIRAFINSCRHRGAKLLEGTGNCKAIRCPYHSWLYSTAGDLRAANGMQETRNFDPSQFADLSKVDEWSGFLRQSGPRPRVRGNISATSIGSRHPTNSRRWLRSGARI
jgi:phenylpropionate dioxygenase-like ring-hydroxylating dioxygenase large terminal subunit